MGAPATEYFDIVNDRDEVIGRAPRAEVHARRLLHRAVHILVFDRQGRLFLQKRSMSKDAEPGMWSTSCSGHVDSGETYDPAAQRELGEELGIFLPAPPERWFRIKACVETGWEFCWVYRLVHEGPFTLHPEEIEAGAWITLNELAVRLESQPRTFAISFRLVWLMASAELAKGDGGPAR
jgi:isopentenyl-diphosphate delta-isomerase